MTAKQTWWACIRNSNSPSLSCRAMCVVSAPFICACRPVLLPVPATGLAPWALLLWTCPSLSALTLRRRPVASPRPPGCSCSRSPCCGWRRAWRCGGSACLRPTVLIACLHLMVTLTACTPHPSTPSMCVIALSQPHCACFDWPMPLHGCVRAQLSHLMYPESSCSQAEVKRRAESDKQLQAHFEGELRVLHVSLRHSFKLGSLDCPHLMSVLRSLRHSQSLARAMRSLFQALHSSAEQAFSCQSSCADHSGCELCVHTNSH